ncbi:major facilitator superfamily domain-containing protein [Apodospora peruviana]|uniref:Major facilitator superfamily domain-containing protein n=1 Tax=Apodospora peruviana TaxID=516989 RepID=A0AAE0M1J7_9PEZI|nr:major facilitator superfamily domain-containing protein [Apodospora peruviana]
MAASQNPDLVEPQPCEKVAEDGCEKSGDDTIRAATDAQSIDRRGPVSARRVLYITVTMLALMSALLLVALDVNILAVAIPRITTDFGSLDDVAWYGSAYSLTKMALQPTFGRLYYSMRLKPTFCAAIALFGAGSIVCALAPTSASLIVGRAMQGCGCAGINQGVLTILAFIVSKERLPIFIALVSSTYAVSSVLGPVIGGVLTESHLTWRFCFWINLPIGAVSTLVTVYSFDEPDRESTKMPVREKLASLDPIGSFILIGAVTSLILALQWGGITLPWSDSKVWGCLLGFVLLVAVFVAHQIRQKERALIPMRILTQRTVAATCAIVTFQMMAVTGLTYYLPVFFQASQGLSPTNAGLYLLGFALPSPIFSLISGAAVTATGQYLPWLLAGGAVLTVGSGLLSTLTVGNSGLGKIIGFEFLASAGFGLAVQQPLVAIRNVVDTEDIPMGSALWVFFQALGTSVGLGIAQVVFLSSLRTKLGGRLPEEEVTAIIALGALGGDRISPDLAPFVAESYGESVQAALYLSVATAGLSLLCAWLVEWKGIKREPRSSS